MLKVLPILLFVFLCQESACASEVRGVRVWAGPDKTRAVLDLNSAAEYRLFHLQNPDRVVIDLQNSHLSGSVLLDQRHSGVADRKDRPVPLLPERIPRRVSI